MSKPFLKWAGGKSKLVPFVESHLPNVKRKRLIEPFCGSGAISFGIEFENYLLADINADLINLFESLKTEKQGFIEYVQSFFVADNNQEERFYELRTQFNQSQDKLERSALFMYLNHHTYNGLCRYNSKGVFNVPFGRYKTVYFPEAEMKNFIKKSSRIELMHSDFESVFSTIMPDDLIYCDPPYVPLSQTASFTAYSQDGFSHQDQERLVKLAIEATYSNPSYVYDIVEFNLDEGTPLYEAVKADYNTVRNALLDPNRGFNSLTGRMGVYIQPRTKGAGHGSVSRAFYARPLFLSRFINLNTN